MLNSFVLSSIIILSLAIIVSISYANKNIIDANAQDNIKQQAEFDQSISIEMGDKIESLEPVTIIEKDIVAKYEKIKAAFYLMRL